MECDIWLPFEVVALREALAATQAQVSMLQTELVDAHAPCLVTAVLILVLRLVIGYTSGRPDQALRILQNPWRLR